jgi:hypothetical protein
MLLGVPCRLPIMVDANEARRWSREITVGVISSLATTAILWLLSKGAGPVARAVVDGGLAGNSAFMMTVTMVAVLVSEAMRTRRRRHIYWAVFGCGAVLYTAFWVYIVHGPV